MKLSMACPYFYPVEREFGGGWAFPARLPLGAGFRGVCRVNADEFSPNDAALRDCCNLGHAHSCPRMPALRHADSVRFMVAADSDGRVVIDYVFDLGHAPAGHGRIEYDCANQKWLATIADTCAQRQAECYLAVYLEKHPRSANGSSAP